MEQEPSFFGLAHPDISMKHRLMHAGAGVMLGFIIGALFFALFLSGMDGLATKDTFLFCVCASMSIFGLIGLISPKWLVDSFLKTLKFMP